MGQMFIHKNSLLINQIIIINSTNMKNIYSIPGLFLLLFSMSVFGQSKIYAPNLRAPENSVIDQMPDVVLDWDAVTGTTLEITYETQLATDPDFTDAVTFPRTEVTAEPMNDLLFGSTYYWRVKAYDMEEPSDWSVTWSFTLIEKFSFTSILQNGKLVYATEDIEWVAVTGLTKYQIQFDTSYTWQLLPIVTNKCILGSFVFPDGKKWIVGEEGLIMHYDGSNWISYDVSDNIDFNDVFFINESSGYAVGDNKVAYHYDGTVWSPIDVNIGSDYNAVSFADENTGWIVGKGGDIISYSDGNWSEDTSFPSDLYSIYTINDTNVWVCGKVKTVAHFDGNEWTKETVGTKDLNDICFIDENNGYVVGKTGSIFHYDGAGWTEEESNTGNELFGVSFSGNVGYAVGAKGTILGYDGGTWEVNDPVIEYTLYTVCVLDDENITAMGDKGIIIDYKGGEGFDSPFAQYFEISPDVNVYQFTNLFFDQPFYYRLRGMHSLDTSEWSMVKSIRTYANTTLLSPTDNSTGLDLLILFQWDKYQGITNYIFEVDTNADFGQPRVYAPEPVMNALDYLNTDTLRVNDFVFGQEYFWRVAAQHAEDISDWSEVWSFTTVFSITLESPEDEAVGISTSPMFTWGEVIGASHYELWVDIDETFGNPNVITVEEPFFQYHTAMEKNTVYYWKVRGKSGALISDWSETRWFKTEEGIGIDEHFNAEAVNIYPNPGNGEFNLYLNSFVVDSYSIKVIDINGKLVYGTEVDCQVGGNSIPIAIDNIVAGAYNIVVSNGEQVVTKRLLIK